MRMKRMRRRKMKKKEKNEEEKENRSQFRKSLYLTSVSLVNLEGEDSWGAISLEVKHNTEP